MKMAEEPFLEGKPSFLRRSTDHELAVRPHLCRKPSALLPPPMHQGQFTPELSPLDAFVSRGRQLYKQLELEDRERKKGGHSEGPHPSGEDLQETYLGGPQVPKIFRSHSAGANSDLTSPVEDWA